MPHELLNFLWNHPSSSNLSLLALSNSSLCGKQCIKILSHYSLDATRLLEIQNFLNLKQSTTKSFIKGWHLSYKYFAFYMQQISETFSVFWDKNIITNMTK